jgi:hypothetical protein
MGYEANDIQFSDDALGLGRALRLSAPPDLSLSFSQDSDNADITIVTYEPNGTKTIERTVITSSVNFGIQPVAVPAAPLYFVDATSGNIIITLPPTITDLGGGLATVNFRDISDTKNTVVADMTNSERTDVTLDL